MAESYRFFDSTTDDKRTYSAADMAEVFGTFFSNGVISGLEVTLTESGSLSVSPGTAVINGYWYKLDGTKVLTPTSSSGAVVVKLDTSTRTISLEYKASNVNLSSEIILAKLFGNGLLTNAPTNRTISSVQINVPAANVLENLLTVDGANSKLDSDMLDGQHGSYYLNYANLTNKPIYLGTAEPSSSIGNDGDIYIQY